MLLLLLTLVPLWWWMVYRGKHMYLRYSDVQLLEPMLAGRGWTHPWLVPSWRVLTLALLILALARPQTGRTYSEVTSEGVDIVLTVDTSGSMRALDMKLGNRHVTRLEVVKDVLAQFIEKREHDRIGMVVFGTEAFTQAPLTQDHGLLTGFMDRVYIGVAGEDTAIGAAIAVGAQRLKDLEAKSKVVILLTDGENTVKEPDPIQAAKAAAELGIKIYTIGIGTQGRAPFEVEGLFGRQIRYLEVSLDEELLKKVADITGARYFRATDTDALKRVYETIDQLETTEVQIKEYHEYTEHYHGLLLAALLMFMIEFIMIHTRLQKLP